MNPITGSENQTNPPTPKMKIKTALRTILALAITLATIHRCPAQEDGKRQTTVDVRALLEKGSASGSLPDGMTIRISACLGEPDSKPAKDDVIDELQESWEFSSNQVHRVKFEYKKDKSIYHRAESRPFDTKDLCKDLLEGKVIEIHAGKGEGPEVAFAGSGYGRGSRFITLVWQGETILELYETNGAGLKLYRETDARAFGKLYERLASQARASFKAKAADAK